ncbi:hypothetical protein IKW75_02415 [Candidatus Saccharibacteria bacterium]|nr:hypothetical protein [Candidatus Saccharibacteria bacterium]
MVIIAVLVGLFALFFFIRHHAGPAHLAMIAGLSVYEMFGVQFTEWLHKAASGIPLDLVQVIVYLALIFVFPMLLYLRSHRGGLFGILRIAEAAVFACIMTVLLSATIAKYLPFDALSGQISGFISSVEGPLVLVGVIGAYLDIMLYHE